MTWLTASISKPRAANIGRDQDGDMTFLELRQSPHTRALRFIAVDRFGGDTRPAQLFRQAVGAMFGAGEDQYTLGSGVLQDVLEQVALVDAFDEIDRLGDFVDGSRLRIRLDVYGLVQDGRAQVLNGLWHGRGEEHGLALGW